MSFVAKLSEMLFQDLFGFFPICERKRESCTALLTSQLFLYDAANQGDGAQLV